MPYETSWLVDKRVLYTRMYDFVTGEELEGMNKELQIFAQASEQLLHTISDATDTTGTDMGLRDLQNSPFTEVANLGWGLYVSPSKMNRFFASVITQLSKKRGRQFATLDESLKFLNEMDDTLPPLSLSDRSGAA